MSSGRSGLPPETRNRSPPSADMGNSSAWVISSDSLPQGSIHVLSGTAAFCRRPAISSLPTGPATCSTTRARSTSTGSSTGADPFAPSGAAEVRKATLTINMTPRDERKGVSKQAIEAQIREAVEVLPGARVKVGFGGSSEKYVLVLAGEDGNALGLHAREVERELRTIPGIGNVTSTSSLVRPELIVRPDFARAADLGVTSAAIADTLRIAT